VQYLRSAATLNWFSVTKRPPRAAAFVSAGKKFPFKNKELGRNKKIVGKPHVRFRAHIAILGFLT
jgi:hypothetical protein